MSASNIRAALRAALHAIAPQLRLRAETLSLLEERLLNAGVAVDAFGAVAMTTKGFAGRDMADFLTEVVQKSEPHFFVATPTKVSPPLTGRSPTTMTAIQKLSFANGDEGPKL